MKTLSTLGRSIPVLLLWSYSGWAQKTVRETPSSLKSSLTISAGTDYIIPKATPFELAGAGSGESNEITFKWQLLEVNGSNRNTTNNKEQSAWKLSGRDNIPIALWESSNTYLSNRQSEVEAAGSLRFRLTGTDEKGSAASDDATFIIAQNAGPFRLSRPETDEVWRAGTFQQVKWDVARTDQPPINCTNVRIDMSVDGGRSFPITLLPSTANDGIAEVLVPDNVNANTRIRIKAIDNVFFDISTHDIKVLPATTGGFSLGHPLAKGCDPTVLRARLQTGSMNGYTTPITLSASGNPVGTRIIFSQNIVRPGTAVEVYLEGNNIPAGNYPITIKGVSGTQAQTTIAVFQQGREQACTNPIDQITITGKQLGVFNVLKWNVNDEPNSRYYVIERSSDGEEYTIISGMEGKDGGSHAYSFTDTKPYKGINFYRVRVVDLDGRITFSKRIKLALDDIISEEGSLYPNPAVGFTTLRIKEPCKQVSLRLLDTQGRSVYQQSNIEVNEGRKILIPLANVNRGMYILSISTEAGIRTMKLVKQ